MAVETVRWGIIGCGNVTEKKSGPGFQQATGSELVAVMRRDGGSAKDYARRHGVPKWFDRADALIRDADVNAIYVATPPSFHKEYVLAAAAAGKAVYVEKPMALNYRECQEMIAACAEANVPLFVAYYRRALPRFLKIKSLLDDGVIGAPRSVNVRFYETVSENDREGVPHWRVDPAISGGGYFVDLGSHTLDILQYYFGTITSAVGVTANQGHHYRAEDLVSAVFVFDSGVAGSGIWSFSAGENVDSLEIVGSAGTLTFSTFQNAPVTVRLGTTIQEFEIPHPPHIEQPLIQTIVDELRGKGRCPSTGGTGSMTDRAIDWILGRQPA